MKESWLLLKITQVLTQYPILCFKAICDKALVDDGIIRKTHKGYILNLGDLDQTQTAGLCSSVRRILVMLERNNYAYRDNADNWTLF